MTGSKGVAEYVRQTGSDEPGDSRNSGLIPRR